MTSGILNGIATTFGPATEVARGDPVKPPDRIAPLDRLENANRAYESAADPRREADKMPPSSSQVRSAVDELNNVVQNSQRAIQFSLDDESGDVIIKVVDAETDEIIRQIPPEEVVRLARQMEESAGSLLRTEV